MQTEQSLAGGDRVYWSRRDLSSVVEGDADEVGEEWNRVLIQSKPASQLSPDVRLCSLVGDKKQHLEGKFKRRDGKDGNTHLWRGQHDSIAALHGALLHHQGDAEFDDEHAGKGAVEPAKLDEVLDAPTRRWVDGSADLCLISMKNIQYTFWNVCKQSKRDLGQVGLVQISWKSKCLCTSKSGHLSNVTFQQS